MASFTANHQSHIFLETIYRDLKKVFAEDEDFQIFQEECERVASVVDKRSKPIYFPVKYNSAQHKPSSTTAELYLNFLTNEDPNVDLKSFKPVEITNDGSVLFRAVASLLGFSSEETVRELRLRSLLHAVLNSFNYAIEYTELQRIIFDSKQISPKNWSSLVHERSQMDEPNAITVFTLIALAKVINIPIRSVYPTPSRQEPDGHPNHIYKLLDKVFYPSNKQHHNTEATPKPIVILWCHTQTKGVTYPDIVVPLFPVDRQHDVKYSGSQISPKKLDITPSSNTNWNASPSRSRGTFILIFTTISSGTTYPPSKRISVMRMTIVELMKNIQTSAKPGDIIEVNTCDEKLTQPPLIPFSEATEITCQKNLHLIDTIQFREEAFPDVSICISAALDKLARQSVYYTDFFWIVDNLIKSTVKTSQSKSVLRVLKESRSIKSQIIARSDASTDPNEHFQSCGPLRVNYLHNNTNDIRHHTNSNTIRNEITIIYEKNRSSNEVKRPEIHAVSTSEAEAIPVSVRARLRFEAVEGSTPETSTKDENNRVVHSPSDRRSQNIPIIQNPPALSEKHYRVPGMSFPPIRFRPSSFSGNN